MSQQQKQPFWYRFLHQSNNADTALSASQNLNDLREVKIITENDLKTESILMEEFRFRGDFLKQIMNDVTSTFNIYFLFLGISISGISVTYQLTAKTFISLQVLAFLSFTIFGIGNTLFFIRFTGLAHLYERHKAVLNDIRIYYIKHLESQIPDIRNVFRISLGHSLPKTYVSILYTVFIVLDSLCFAGAAFVLTELWLHINTLSSFSYFSDPLSYIFALLTSMFVLAFHFLFYRFIFLRDKKKLQSLG